MSDEINKSFRTKFHDTFIHLSQQKPSKLFDKVRTDPDISAAKAYFDRLGSVSMNKRTGRGRDTLYTNTPHSRRRVVTETYDGAELIDNPEKIMAIADPTNPYMQGYVWAANRKKDSLIIAAMNGNAYSVDSDDTATAVAMPAAQVVAAGGTGATFSKLLLALEVLSLKDLDDESDIYGVISPKQVTDMLNDIKLTSADYQDVKALKTAKVGSALGINWCVSNLLTKSGSDRQCFIWLKNAMGVAVLSDVKTEIDRMPGKNYATQVFVSVSMGATRIEDEKIVQFDCQE